MTTQNKKHTNKLIHETSPYLLQHAHNPVDWHAWNEETLEKAKKEDKPILVSIGYSACHWCHVMEHESFEDEDVAKIMNEYFICIKVDREERPDVDQVYMDAVQAVSGQGGWPLNCFALPDGRPFWGATYFPKNQWLGVLEQIHHVFVHQRKDVENQASEIENGLQNNPLISVNTSEDIPLNKEMIEEMVLRLSERFDSENGGTKGSPKFPMPNISQFLLRCWYHSGRKEIKQQVETTLTKMATGGIYDQIGGGFSRYSVDDHWHVPHFEKMLYDNAQLVSLYSEAFAATKNPLYHQVIEETLKFVNLELTSPEGGFYSALDADSEGEEGKFYVWTKKEIEEVTGDDADLVKTFYGIDQEAYWEEGKNVLIREASFESLSLLFNLTEKAIKEKIASAGQKLFQHRSKRVRPGLDDKILTSWNALMLKGYVDAFKALGEQKYLDAALQNAAFLRDKLQHPDGSIYRNFKNDKASIPGFLDDYAFTIEAYNALYEVTFDDKWINMAMELADYTLNHFYSEKSGMFFYTSDRHTDVITRKTEVLDNVIPASNSAMAKGLFQLGLIFEKPEYLNIPVRMLNNVNEKMAQFPSAFSNWGILLLQIIHPYYTFVITGEEAHKKKLGILKEFHPDIFMAGSTAPSELPLFYQRFEKNKTRIFVCSGKECKAPVTDAFEALSLLSS